ncbi:MAG TPA: hypothetical protein VHW67_06140 [Solirubrobacteraceae bacterium]|jgi:hypothetical protein|nr:hypothetical protein [Solirubrobacteraceae bacterium]
MPQEHSNRHALAAAATTLLLLAALLLSACGGGSSKGASGTTSTNAASTKRGGQFGARAASLRACLKKNGITLPERQPGQRRSGQSGSGEGAAPGTPGARGPFGTGGSGGPQLPKGVTRSRLEAAFKKCGGGSFSGRARGFDSAAGAQRFAKFAACMRKNGVKLPSPNTSGKGPIFNTKGIDTSSAAFKSADAKCMKELAPSRAGGAAGGGVPAPGGGEGSPPGAAEGPGSAEAPGAGGAPPAGGGLPGGE